MGRKKGSKNKPKTTPDNGIILQPTPALANQERDSEVEAEINHWHGSHVPNEVKTKVFSLLKSVELLLKELTIQEDQKNNSPSFQKVQLKKD